jgi:hypothetical protein
MNEVHKDSKYGELYERLSKEADKLMEAGDTESLGDLVATLQSVLLFVFISQGKREDAREGARVLHDEIQKAIDLYFLEGNKIPLNHSGTA